MREAACLCVHHFSLIVAVISHIGEHRPKIWEAAAEVNHIPGISPEAERQ